MFNKDTVESIIGIDKQVSALNALIQRADDRRVAIGNKMGDLQLEDEALGSEVAKAKRAIEALSNI